MKTDRYPLHPRFYGAAEKLSVIVTAVAVDLAANFPTGPARTVYIYVSGSGSNSADQLSELSRGDASLIRKVSNISRGDCTRDRGGGCRAGLSPSRTVAEVGAQEHADRTSHALLSEVN